MKVQVKRLVGYVALDKEKKATSFIARFEFDPSLEEKGWTPTYVEEDIPAQVFYPSHFDSLAPKESRNELAKDNRKDREGGDGKDTPVRVVNDPDHPIEAARHLRAGGHNRRW